IKSVLEEFGRLDVLVHSAGIFRFGTGQMEMQDLQALLNTNVMAVHNINQIALPLLRMSPNPHLFAIASITGVEPFAMVGGYASSKHALVGYIRSIAQEESANGVRVTAICPDVVDTDMAAASGMPKSDMIRPDDIAKTIEFVMSLSPAVALDQITIGCRPTAGSVRDAA
ncbi:MAG: SDR family oxidoreductase, partial [Pseudomonadota bacterium]